MRFAFGFLVAAAGMFCGGMAMGMIALLMWGGWPAALYPAIVTIFGWALGGFIFCMAMVIGFLAVGGPVGRFKAGAGPTGASLEVNDAAPPTVTTTTVVGAQPLPPQ
jgi:hypothetical protein